MREIRVGVISMKCPKVRRGSTFSEGSVRVRAVRTTDFGANSTSLPSHVIDCHQVEARRQIEEARTRRIRPHFVEYMEVVKQGQRRGSSSKSRAKPKARWERLDQIDVIVLRQPPLPIESRTSPKFSYFALRRNFLEGS